MIERVEGLEIETFSDRGYIYLRRISRKTGRKNGETMIVFPNEFEFLIKKLQGKNVNDVSQAIDTAAET